MLIFMFPVERRHVLFYTYIVGFFWSVDKLFFAQYQMRSLLHRHEIDDSYLFSLHMVIGQNYIAVQKPESYRNFQHKGYTLL